MVDRSRAQRLLEVLTDRIHRALTDERQDLVAFARRAEALLERQD